MTVTGSGSTWTVCATGLIVGRLDGGLGMFSMSKCGQMDAAGIVAIGDGPGTSTVTVTVGPP